MFSRRASKRSLMACVLLVGGVVIFMHAIGWMTVSAEPVFTSVSPLSMHMYRQSVLAKTQRRAQPDAENLWTQLKDSDGTLDKKEFLETFDQMIAGDEAAKAKMDALFKQRQLENVHSLAVRMAQLKK